MSYKITKKEQLEIFVTQNWNKVNAYLDKVSEGLPIPIYNSVDIRESADKYAPVDNNIYPAGFNNICLLDLNVCTDRFKRAFEKRADSVQHVGILTESHTKNTFYLEHLAYLKDTLERSGVTCSLISFDENLFEGKEQLSLTSQSGAALTIFKASVEDHIICCNQKNLDYVILNNDQSKPIEIDWDSIKTPVEPTPRIGWYKRQKTKHFKYYAQVLNDFAEHFSIWPCLMQALFKEVNDIDFESKEGLENLSQAITELQTTIGTEKKIFIKANQGTYGMGIMVVDKAEDVINMNRKNRNKMDTGKNSIKFTSVIVQEGIETIIKHGNDPAEITIYLIDGKSCGGFMRTNSLKDSQSNLNSKGMVFQKFCMSEIMEGHDHKAKEAIYSTIARLSTIASAYEIKEVLK